MTQTKLKILFDIKSFLKNGKLNYLVNCDGIESKNHFKCSQCMQEFIFELDVTEDLFIEEEKQKGQPIEVCVKEEYSEVKYSQELTLESTDSCINIEQKNSIDEIFSTVKEYYIFKDEPSDSIMMPNKSYECPMPECTKTYLSHNGFRRHIMAYHPEEGPKYSITMKDRICPYCDKIFKPHEKYIQHIRLHEDQHAFSCKNCSKSFLTSNNLRRHINDVHLKHKPFVCEICGKGFSQKTSLQTHLTTHQNLENLHIPKYICDICKSEFQLKKYMELHIKNHHLRTGNQSCQVCQKVLLRQNLNRHLKDVHGQGEQTIFKCRHCDKSYKNKAYLDIHESIHTGEKRFECKICGAKFTDNGTRYAHVKRYHPEEFAKRKKRHRNFKDQLK